MSGPLPNKRQLAEQKSYRLLTTALQRLCEPNFAKNGEPRARTIEQVAAELAEENKSLPPELCYGPTGTTSQTTMAK